MHTYCAWLYPYLQQIQRHRRSIPCGGLSCSIIQEEKPLIPWRGSSSNNLLSYAVSGHLDMYIFPSTLIHIPILVKLRFFCHQEKSLARGVIDQSSAKTPLFSALPPFCRIWYGIGHVLPCVQEQESRSHIKCSTGWNDGMVDY